MQRRTGPAVAGIKEAVGTTHKEKPSNLQNHEVRLEDIDPHPHQPRRFVDPASIEELARSIQQDGLQQPIKVMRNGNRFVLVYGQRRLLAHQQLGRQTITAQVVDPLPMLEARKLALLENLLRQDLNPFEEVQAQTEVLTIELSGQLESPTPEGLKRLLRKLRELPADHEQVQAMQQVFDRHHFGPFSSFLTNKLPLLDLPEDLLAALNHPQRPLDYTKAKLLKNLTPEERQVWLGRLQEENLTLAELRQALKQKPRRTPARGLVDDLRKGRPFQSKYKKLPENQQRRIDELLKELQDLLK